MNKCKCKRCGKVMNIPRSWADYCYDCEDNKQERYELVKENSLSLVYRDTNNDTLWTIPKELLRELFKQCGEGENGI